MASRDRSGRAARRSPLDRVVRRAFVVVGLGALFGGAVWSTASIARGAAHRPSPADASAFRPEDGVAAQCLTVRARQRLEEESCFHRVQRELLEGRLDLREAIARLEACGSTRPEQLAALERHRALRIEDDRARIAFGLLPREAAAAGHRLLAERFGVPTRSPAPAAVDRLRRAGISPDGLSRDGRPALSRLRASASLRRDFREVFGRRTADDLERLLAADGPAPLRAVVLGNTVIVPNAPTPPSAGHTVAVPDPEVLTLARYTEIVLDDLDFLEDTRLRYLASAGHAHRLTGSIGGFVSSLMTGSEPDERSRAAARRAAVDSTVMQARLRNLELQLGLDPALHGMAREGVAFAADLSRACESAALRRRARIRTGAGVVTGLTGGAVVVVATGVVGTLLGGVTLAAALEAAGGAYLVYRSELSTLSAAEAGLPAAAEPVPPPAEERFRAPDRPDDVAHGEVGDGRGEVDDLREGGEWTEWDALGYGEGEELHDGDESTEPEPRTNTIPPTLPPPLPEEAMELPPMLADEVLDALRRPTLAEAQQRIDEFLALETPVHLASAPAPEAISTSAVAELIEEARASLELWVDRRELSPGFGSFFLRAELLELPAAHSGEALRRANDRYARDRAAWHESESLEDLRQRVAERLVTHCRGGTVQGDLMLEACSDPTALTLVLIAAIRDAGLTPPAGSALGVQAQGPDYHAVLYFGDTREVLSLATGERTTGVSAPIYHPASFYYGFLVEHGVRPDVDPEEHLLIARPEAGETTPVVGCDEAERRNVFGRVLDWVRSLVGMDVPSRRGSACGAPGGGVPGRQAESGARDPAAGDEQRVGVSISIPRPSIPMPGGGAEGGSSSSKGGGNGQGDSGSAGGGKAGDQEGDGGSESGAVNGEEGGQGGGGNGTGGRQASGSSGGAGGGAATAPGSEGGELGGDGSDGNGHAGSAAAERLDLVEIGRAAEELGRAAREDRTLGLRSWRLTDKNSFMPSQGRVLYADNERALSRFAPGDRFITMSPSQTEEQRRMFEARSFPIFAAETDCSAPRLPPRRVFRRATGGGEGYRYVFCDQDESVIAFRTREEAATYARLGAPDRPLLLTRLASDRIEGLERSPRVATIHAILRDPNVLRSLTIAELDSLNGTVAELLWFQERMEAALFRSMAELEGSEVRGYYYDLHRQVAQSSFVLDFVRAVHRFNQRLAADPLRTLAWADALPPEHRQRFFRLYFSLGTAMSWPARWEALHRRYGDGDVPALSSTSNPDAPSLDFLQVMSDPTRVQVDWPDERPPRRPSIRDVRVQEGRESTHLVKADPTVAEELARQDDRLRRRGGTRGLGRTGEGEGLGPERGRRPLQMIHIRVRPETGDPDRPRLPENNPTRPGGTEGRRKVQERSASRQEPALWISPGTFIDAILSGWNPPGADLERSDRVPPVIRFSPRLREMFLAIPDEDELYEGRLYYAITVLTSGEWLRYADIRDAMGGTWSGVRAQDNGRYALEYSMTAPIVDQDQVGGPDFFTEATVDVPADLLPPVERIFTRDGGGTFDLHVLPPAEPVALPQPEPGSPEAAEARERLRRKLRLIAEQARSPE